MILFSNGHSMLTCATVALLYEYLVLFLFCLVPLYQHQSLCKFKVMWFRLGIDGFIAKKTSNNNGCDMYVSDCVQMWHRYLSNGELASIFKELNPLFDASISKLKELVLKLFDNDDKIQKEIKRDKTDLILNLQSCKTGIKYQFKVVLKPRDSATLYKEFTLPLMLMMVKLQNRQEKLVKIIKEKDTEIEEYKQENAYIMMKNYAATKPFVEEEFEKEEMVDPILHEVVRNPSLFLDYVDKKLLNIEKIDMFKEEPPILNDTDNKSINDDKKCDMNKLVFKNRNVEQSSGFKPCVKIDHQIIKRRKKNDTFKIKL